MQHHFFYNPATGSYTINNTATGESFSSTDTANFTLIESFSFKNFPLLFCYNATSGLLEIKRIYKFNATTATTNGSAVLKTIFSVTFPGAFSHIVPFIHANELFYLAFSVATAKAEVYKLDLEKNVQFLQASRYVLIKVFHFFYKLLTVFFF